jgi:hypothetical protein
LVAATETLLRAAQRAGQVRGDVSFADLLMSLAALTRPLAGASWRQTEQFFRRSLQIYLDGLRVHSELPGRPAALEDLRRRDPG